MTTDAELVARYRDAAEKHGAATAKGDYKNGNRAYHVVTSAYRELRKRGLPSQRLLLTLLNDEDAAVRSWAATHALEFASHKGVPVLEALAGAEHIGIQRLIAETTLSEWRKGALKFP
ncbi:MAG: DUF2019 domain-containing protein [Alphaproteobacteria bacterium]|nr:DUF2019 domain-containing protein [Alphaproteobacteria bacterium]MBL6937142.1 DUF2019 domain-containing protein [Alphaproteobacteria bacterium]MBL7096296.1 DUF2019 domain-containing protein [Alphaproteobacteria bacterium]